MSAAAYLFCYFAYYSPIEGVKIRNSTKLCLVYHKPRLEVGLQKALVFASNPNQMVKLSAADRTTFIGLTQQFDNVFDVMVTLRRIAGYEIKQHLQDSYNANGDVAIPLPQGIQT
ncbi:hypothetical protein SC171_05500 [Pantoea cypripedii]|uniref:hypothetical protein n=1 Tax=Pantoea cypripedii TaxID=55209 RepID=UPI002FC6748B